MNVLAQLAQLLTFGRWPGAESPRATSEPPLTPQAATNNAYSGAELNRLHPDFPRQRSGDSAIYEDQEILSARLRQMFRNDPLMQKCKREFCKHVSGPHGIQTFADVLMSDGQPGEQESDDRFNFESDELFKRWAEEEADAEGKFSWAQMQWLHFSEAVARGGSLLLEVSDETPGRTVPLCYQLLEYEQLDRTRDRPASDGQNRIINGIEFDARNRAVAYYIHDVHPHDTFSGGNLSSSRIPARRVIHTFFPDRPSQNIGVTLFAGNVQNARDLDWYLGNELTAAALGALLTMVVKRKYGQGSGLGLMGSDPNATTDEYGNSLCRLGPGLVANVGPEDSVEMAESKRPSRNASDFIDLILRQAGQAAGLSVARVSGDYKATSYSAGRAMHLDDAAYFTVLQSWSARSYVLPVRRRHTQVAAAFGRYQSISPRQFRNRQFEMLRLRWQGIGREQLDPEKETQAAMERIRAGLSDWEHECALRGVNWRESALKRKQQIAFFEKHGVPFDLSSNGKPAAEQAATANTEAARDGE